MDQRIVPPPGTPAAELSRLTDEERQLSEREAALLTQGAAVESQARDVQHALDEARAALQRLSTTPARAEAEKLGESFRLSCRRPPGRTTPRSLTRRAVRKNIHCRMATGEAPHMTKRERGPRNHSWLQRSCRGRRMRRLGCGTETGCCRTRTMTHHAAVVVSIILLGLEGAAVAQETNHEYIWGTGTSPIHLRYTFDQQSVETFYPGYGSSAQGTFISAASTWYFGLFHEVGDSS